MQNVELQINKEIFTNKDDDNSLLKSQTMVEKMSFIFCLTYNIEGLNKLYRTHADREYILFAHFWKGSKQRLEGLNKISRAKAFKM